MIELAVARYLPSVVSGLVFNEVDTGGNVFVGHMPSKPDVALAVMRYGAGPQLSKAPTSLPRLQLRTRGVKDDPIGPAQLAAAIFDAVACLDGVLLDAGGPDEVWVIGCDALQSAPYPLGADENGRHEHVVNTEWRIHDPTAHRPAIPA